VLLPGDIDIAATAVLEVSARLLPERLRELQAQLKGEDKRQVVWVCTAACHLIADAVLAPLRHI
jgi:hypothetical protein